MNNYNLKDEYSQLLIKFHNNTMEYSEKQNSYFKKCFNINNQSGEIQSMGFNVDSWFKNQSSITLQKVLYIKTLSRERGLLPFFITFTNNTIYNPFYTYNNGNTVKSWKINKKFGFDSIEDAMREGYSNLEILWREFYLLLKKGNRKFKEDSKEILFIQSLEFQKSFIPHLHSLIFVPESMVDWVKECYEKVIEKYNFNIKGQDIKTPTDFNNYSYTDGKDGIDGASNYITKYIIKNLEDNKGSFGDFQRMIFGWKRSLGNRVRLFKSSNIKLTMEVYKKVYHNLSEDLKEKILNDAKDNNTCLLWELEKITHYKKVYVECKDTNTYSLETKEKIIEETIIREKEFNKREDCLVSVEIKKEVIVKLKTDLDLDNDLLIEEGIYLSQRNIDNQYGFYVDSKIYTNNLLREYDYKRYKKILEDNKEIEEDEEFMLYDKEYEIVYKTLELRVYIEENKVFDKKDWELREFENNFEEIELEFVS